MQAPTRLTMEINIKLNLKLSLREHKETSGGNPEGDAFVWDEDTDAKKTKKKKPERTLFDPKLCSLLSYLTTTTSVSYLRGTISLMIKLK